MTSKWFRGSVTLSRFEVKGPKPRQFDDTHLARLRDRAAGHQKVAFGDGSEIGWAAGGHVWDTDFTELKNVYPDHLVFDFWTQVDKIPGDLLRAVYERELAALCKDNPSGFPSGRNKRDARELARSELEEKAKDGRFKKWKCVPVAWDAVRNELLAGTASAKVLERLQALFVQTFDADLTQHERFAERLVEKSAARLAAAISPKAKDAVLSPFVPGVTPPECRWATFDDSPDFLGSEFLLWLWHRAAAGEDAVVVKDESEVTFHFAGGVRLEHAAEKDNDTINAASAVRKPQALRAVQSGYLPRKAALTLVRHNQQFTFKLADVTLAITGAKLPNTPADVEGARPREEWRLSALRDLSEALDLLYGHFAERRMSSLWPHDLADMQSWLAAKPEKAAAGRGKKR